MMVITNHVHAGTDYFLSLCNKKFIMKKILLIILILVTIFLLYWIKIRPTNIRSHCNQVALQKSPVSLGDVVSGKVNAGEDHDPKLYNDYYSICLHEYGL